MRKMALTAGAALMAIASPALAEDWDTLLTNTTGKEIKKLEIAVAGSGTFVASQAEEGTVVKPVKNAAKTTLRYDKPDKQCRFDIKATFADDTNAVWTGFDACKNMYLTLVYRNNTPTFTAN
jgi:hypothetical protein